MFLQAVAVDVAAMVPELLVALGKESLKMQINIFSNAISLMSIVISKGVMWWWFDHSWLSIDRCAIIGCLRAMGWLFAAVETCGDGPARA